jgi:hypothetical protein
MDLTITPFVGVGPLQLGMDQAEVAALPFMGLAETTMAAPHAGMINEMRGKVGINCGFVDGRLAEIVVQASNRSLLFLDINLFGKDSDSILDAVERSGGELRLFGNSIFVMQQGIVLREFIVGSSAFVANQARHDPRTVAVMPKGAFARFAPVLKPFRRA